MTATATHEPGRMLAELLRLTIVGTEGHDLKVACVSCMSSDGGRVHKDDGRYFCFVCQKRLNAFDLCKVVLQDHEAAKRIMHETGLFPELVEAGKGGANGNGHAAAGKAQPMTPEQVLEAVAKAKGVTAAALKAYGAHVHGNSVAFPVFGPDGKPCSTFTMTLKGDGTVDKGLYAKGKPTGLFFPCELSQDETKGTVHLPQPGETWAVAEGVKDPATLSVLGFKAAGLPTSHLNPKFAPLFKGVDAVVVPDQDEAGENGAAKTASALHSVAKSVRMALFPIEYLGCDVRDILKQAGLEAGAEIIRTAIAKANPVNAEGEVQETIDYGLITGTELLSRDCRLEYLIPGVLAKTQHTLLGAPLKGCKSLIALDMAIALSTGGTFLNYFPVPQPVKTIVISLESGWPVLQSNIRRISNAAGVAPSQLDNLLVAVKGPKFGKTEHMSAIADIVVAAKAEIVIIDCAYRCMPGDVASNVLSMGELLDSVGCVFEEAGSTLLLIHHSPKHIPPGEPLQLDNLAFAGFAEFAAQWLLINRRTAYQPGSGHHELWLTIGARAGHGGLYGLEIEEGEFHQGQDREWSVVVTQSKDVWKETHKTREKERDSKRLAKLEASKARVLRAAAKFKEGGTVSDIRTNAGLDGREFSLTLAALLEAGDLLPREIQKSNRKTPYPGYIMAVYATPAEGATGASGESIGSNTSQ
jgi:hypothetical protein